MSIRYSLGTLAFSATLLCSCSKDSEPVKAVEQTVDEPKLMSTWEGPCKLKVLDLSARQIVRFSGASFEEAFVGYEDKDCKVQSVQLRYQGKLTLRDEPKGIRHIDLQYENASVKPMSKKGKEVLETLGLCDIKVWEVQKRQDISKAKRDLNCPFRETPTLEFNSALVEGDHLFLGKAGLLKGGVEDEKNRPTNVDREQSFQHSSMNLGD